MALALALALAGALPAGLGAQSAPADPLDRLAWLAGCWEGRLASGATYEESWLAPRAGTMVGVARATRDGRALSFEFMRIYDDAGTPVFAAQPSGRPATLFRAAAVGAGRVTFENPAHDFPQRVLYRLEPPDRLLARIEGERDGESRAVDFPLRRVACPGEAPPMTTDDALAALRREYMDAFNRGDADAVAALHTEGSVSMSAGMPALVGRDAIRELMRASLAGAPPGLRFEFEPVEVRVADGWAVERGATKPAGPFPAGKYVMLYERGDDGAWRIAWTITNSDAPPPSREQRRRVGCRATSARPGLRARQSAMRVRAASRSTRAAGLRARSQTGDEDGAPAPAGGPGQNSRLPVVNGPSIALPEPLDGP